MPAPMATVVTMMGWARFSQASTSACVRSMPPRRATSAYSTSRIEFLVTMPMSIRMPMVAGSDMASPLSNSRPSAPPIDSGSAAMMVSGCAKSWNSSTSTQ